MAPPSNTALARRPCTPPSHAAIARRHRTLPPHAATARRHRTPPPPRLPWRANTHARVVVASAAATRQVSLEEAARIAGALGLAVPPVWEEEDDDKIADAAGGGSAEVAAAVAPSEPSGLASVESLEPAVVEAAPAIATAMAPSVMAS